MNNVEVSLKNFKILSDGISKIAEENKVSPLEFIGFLMEMLCLLSHGKEIRYKSFVLRESDTGIEHE